MEDMLAIKVIVVSVVELIGLLLILLGTLV